MRIAAERQHGRMLQQEQCVTDKLLLPCRDDLLLDGHRFPIGDTTEIEEVDVHDELCSHSFAGKENSRAWNSAFFLDLS